VGLRARITVADRSVMTRVAATDSVLLDQMMPRLSAAANNSVLWLAIAAGLAATRSKRTRRAALRGVASIAIASVSANQVVKPLTRRLRPAEEIAIGRRLVRMPRSTSFPSGHAASAAAFTTGLALEIPALAAPAGVLAAAVGASRVVTGAHYPSDVVAGFALGTAAGFVTLRWWPRRPAAPAAAVRPRSDAPAAPAGAGLALVLNSQAGTASPDLEDYLREQLPEARIVVAAEGEDLEKVFAEAAADTRILGVAGGDGTVRVAVQAALDASRPLLVVPAGTFNHFAAELGVHSRDDALAALRAGDSVLVDVAMAGSDVFVNTASVGVYTELVKARRQLEGKIGKWPAVLVALARVLRDGKPLELTVNGRPRRVWLLFIGAGRYEPQGAAPTYRPDLDDGELDVRVIDGTQPLARIRLVAAVALGTLGRSRVYRAWTASSLRLESAGGQPLELSLDGEATESEASVLIRKRPARLLVYRPDAGSS
jgi:diacylglycerol kinase family enzyme/membrane-associated phospholipid phosphatase